MTSGELPAPLREFVRLVNRGDFWESHEVLEDPWRRTRSPFYHGLILYASAFVHLERGNPHGVRAQLSKALEALDGLGDVYLGVDLAAVRRHARRARGVAPPDEEENAEGWSGAIDRPRLDLDPARIRGDEPELGG